MTYEQAIAEPWQEVERVLYVWSLDAKRDKLEADRQQQLSA